MEEAVYASERITLLPGEVLFLYTDGVTEAKNGQEEPYGESRLLAALQERADRELGDIIHGIRADGARHAGGAPQSDDVTMLAITYRGIGTNTTQ
jgi:sigma-B regulation protein RsbU (phosphoserine phosphatase)